MCQQKKGVHRNVRNTIIPEHTRAETWTFFHTENFARKYRRTSRMLIISNPRTTVASVSETIWQLKQNSGRFLMKFQVQILFLFFFFLRICIKNPFFLSMWNVSCKLGSEWTEFSVIFIVLQVFVCCRDGESNFFHFNFKGWIDFSSLITTSILISLFKLDTKWRTARRRNED